MSPAFLRRIDSWSFLFAMAYETTDLMLLFLQLADTCKICYRIGIDGIGKCRYEDPPAVDDFALVELSQDGFGYGNWPGFSLHFHHST